MTEERAIKLFKCLADKSRIQIIKSLIIEDMYVERLAQRLNLSPSTISFHLKKLEDAGAVDSFKDQYYTVYSLKKDIFNANIMNILKEKSEDKDLQEQRELEYREKVIKSFFVYGKLKNIPAQQKKKRIILEEIVKSFKEEVQYTEREVNIIIADFHDDFCTLRRDMISEGLLHRDGSIYTKNKK